MTKKLAITFLLMGGASATAGEYKSANPESSFSPRQIKFFEACVQIMEGRFTVDHAKVFAHGYCFGKTEAMQSEATTPVLKPTPAMFAKQLAD